MALEQPKKAPSAYFVFLDAKRAEVTELIVKKGIGGKEKTGAVAKECAERWKALGPKDKKVYEDKAAALKKEYEAKLAKFKEAGGEMAKRKRKGKDGEDGKGKRKKKERDPDAPKKLVGGSFGIFMTEMRPQLMKELAGKPTSEVTKLASARWKEMKDSEKAVYDKKYKEAKAKYDEAYKEYAKKKAAQKADAPAGGEEDGDDEEDEEEDE